MLKLCPMQFRGGIAEHLLNSRVNGLHDAAVGMQGDDAIGHGIENGLDQGSTVAQGLLCCIFAGNITEHQDRPDHLIVAVTNRCATVGNITLAAVAGNEYGVVGQALYRALRQGFQDREW